MNAALNIAVSGMRAASTNLAASAANLANLESVSSGQQVAPAPGGGLPVANLQGLMVAPEIDPAREVVNQMTASLAYRANIASFKTAEQMEKTLLDALA